MVLYPVWVNSESNTKAYADQSQASVSPGSIGRALSRLVATLLLCVSVLQVQSCAKPAYVEVNRTASDLGLLRSIAKGEEELRWLENSTAICDSGDSQVCAELAMHYYSNEKYELSSRYYNNACEGEVAESCAEFALALSEGKGIVKDVEASEYYYAKACALGHVTTCGAADQKQKSHMKCISSKTKKSLQN